MPDEKKIKKYSKLCDDVLDLFTDSQKSIYFYFLGSYQLYDLNDCKLGEINLNKSAHFDSDGEILGMTYNQLGIVKLKSRHLHEAYLLQIKSREILQKFNCYKRLVYPELTLGDILLQKRLKDEAEAQYLRTIQLCKQLGNVRTMNIAFSNLAYGMMTMVHDYSKAIYYCQQLIDVDEYKQQIYYILSWSYYYLKESKEASYYLSLLNDVNTHQSLEIDTYAIGLKYCLEGKHELYYQKLLNYYNQIKDDFKTYDKIVVLEKLIEYCSKHQKYKEGYNFQQEYIQVIKIV